MKTGTKTVAKTGLSEAMNARKITSKEMAKKLGVSIKTIEQWRSISGTLPQFRAKEIGEILNLPEDYLVKQFISERPYKTALEEMMDKKHMRSVELLNHLGITKDSMKMSVSNWRNGRSPIPQKYRPTLCKLFNVTEEELTRVYVPVVPKKEVQKSHEALVAVLRHIKGVSQVKMGEDLGVSSQTISNWENGLGMTARNIVLLSQYFKVDPELIAKDVQLHSVPKRKRLKNSGFKIVTSIKGVKHTDIADKLHIDRSAVDRWSKGDAIPQKHLSTLGEYLDVPEELLTMEIDVPELIRSLPEVARC